MKLWTNVPCEISAFSRCNPCRRPSWQLPSRAQREQPIKRLAHQHEIAPAAPDLGVEAARREFSHRGKPGLAFAVEVWNEVTIDVRRIFDDDHARLEAQERVEEVIILAVDID